MPAGSTGQDAGIAACHSSLTHARSAPAANGRIRQLARESLDNPAAPQPACSC